MGSMNVTLAITLSQQTTIAWEMCGRYEYHPTEFSDLCIRFNLDKEFKPCLNIAPWPTRTGHSSACQLVRIWCIAYIHVANLINGITAVLA